MEPLTAKLMKPLVLLVNSPSATLSLMANWPHGQPNFDVNPTCSMVSTLFDKQNAKDIQSMFLAVR
jgi:hypothetical protein